MAPIRRCRTCAICRKRYGRQNLKDRCRQWVKNIGNEDLAYIPIEKLYDIKYVCGDHFQSKDFNTKKSRLKKCLLMRNECQKINESFSLSEDISIDNLNKAQQGGTAK